jgi:hypothetical protein
LKRFILPTEFYTDAEKPLQRPWPAAIAGLIAEIGDDGINSDTQDEVPLVFASAADKIGHRLTFEPEDDPSDEAFAWNVTTWGQYKIPFSPLVDEFVDEHTRRGILGVGSYYQPQGSIWYFPQAYKLTEHGKLRLISPGMDRSGGVGFRCAVDSQ